MKNASHLLDEAPMLVYPTLARILGINSAVMLQQLHFLLNSTKTAKNKYNFIEERWWVYNSYQEWQRDHFSWLSISNIKRLFLNLEELGVVLSMQGVKNPSDRRKWYTIDYEFWEKYVAEFGQKLADASDKNDPTIGQKLSDGSSDKNDPMTGQKLADDSTETPPETPSENDPETTTTALVVVVDEIDQNHWLAAFHQLEMQLDLASFETFLRGAVLKRVERDEAATTFVIGVRHSYAQEMLQNRLYRNVRRVLSDVSGGAKELRFEIDEALKPASAISDGDDGAIPLFRILAEQQAAHDEHPQDTHRKLFEQFIGAVTPAHEAALADFEASYDIDTFVHALKLMDGKRAQGKVNDPLSYTQGILRNLRKGA